MRHLGELVLRNKDLKNPPAAPLCKRGALRNIGLILGGILLLPFSAHAATYYVRTDGNNANNGLTNASNGAWKTISYAAGHVTPGDVVRVQAGTYVEVAAPSVSGTSGKTVTLVADGAVTTCGMSFSNKSYIRVVGFTFDPTVSGCSANPVVNGNGTNTGLEFWNDTIASNANGKGYDFDFNRSCTQCIFIGGSINNIGGGSVADTALSIYGNDVFVGYINISTVCYLGITQGGNRIRVVNVDFSGFEECAGAHPDFFFPDGSDCCGSTWGFSNNLVESVFGIGSTNAPDNKFAHQSIQVTSPWNDNVWRFNVAYNLGSGFYSVYGNATGAQNRLRFYNNTLAYCNRANPGPPGNNCGNIDLNAGGSVSIYNELFYQGWADADFSNVYPWDESAGTFSKDYSLAYSPLGKVSFQSTWTTQVHPQTNVNPQLNNPAGMDLTLQSNSGARGVGGPLTTASGSGSGTSLTVAANTGSFFIGDNSANLPQYGGQLVPGDFITVGVTPVQVASVSGDVLTLATPISWNNGDPVYFGASPTIDEGAYPYKAGGYTLTASYSQSGGNAIITPNDSGLVRFVVCYQNGIPTTVMNTAPYSCPMGSGAFQAIVYPRYASQIQQVVATPNGITFSSCDLNNDGVTNVSDVQLCVNQAIGVQSCTTGDINKDGSCNVIDVQRDVNAALGGNCVTQ